MKNKNFNEAFSCPAAFVCQPVTGRGDMTKIWQQVRETIEWWLLLISTKPHI
jgi:hypothetical protein